jgi:hypothetical protein
MVVSAWGPITYGDPCRECGFAWTMGTSDAVALIADAPAMYADLLRDATGTEGAPELDWNVGGYVSHVADNLRIWAERLVAATVEQPLVVSPYDADALGAARGYNNLQLSGALWSLHEAVDSWQRAWTLAGERRVLVHPDRGRITAEHVARTNAHDVFHHQHDIRRCLGIELR